MVPSEVSMLKVWMVKVVVGSFEVVRGSIETGDEVVIRESVLTV